MGKGIDRDGIISLIADEYRVAHKQRDLLVFPQDLNRPLTVALSGFECRHGVSLTGDNDRFADG